MCRDPDALAIRAHQEQRVHHLTLWLNMITLSVLVASAA